MDVLRIVVLVTSAIIDLMIIYNFTAVVRGFIYTTRRRRTIDPDKITLEEYPMLSIIVPAHNEEGVIRPTVLSLLNQDYPQDRYELIVVDDNSSDRTGEILREMLAEFPDRNFRVLTTDENTGGTGKSRVLNMAVRHASGSVISVFDADNTPESGNLRLLVCALLEDEKIAAVSGKFRTRNKKETLLTRLVDMETLLAQAIAQAGHWASFKAGVLPGTNFVIRRSVLEEVGGWDETALTEDTEISFRILKKNYLIRFIPEAVTWEQEPAHLRPWLRQRNRWARGNMTLMLKNIPNLFRRHPIRFKIIVMFMVTMYLFLFTCVLISDTMFFGHIFGFLHIDVANKTIGAIYHYSWPVQILAYFIMTIMAVWQEKEERTFLSIILLPVLLFGYGRLWMIVIVCALARMINDAIHHRKASWDKTDHPAEN